MRILLVELKDEFIRVDKTILPTISSHLVIAEDAGLVVKPVGNIR